MSGTLKVNEDEAVVSSGQRVDLFRTQGNISGLCRLLQHKDVLIRRRATVALGELRNPTAVACLSEALHSDSDDYVRRWAIEALRKIGSPEAVDALVKAMFSASLQIGTLAEGALTNLSNPRAQAALQINQAIMRGDWQTLADAGEDGQQALNIILSSKEYTSWPTARQQKVLEAAVKLGVTPPDTYRSDLADIGLYVSGVHTVNDLFNGLENRNPKVRISAAEKLGSSGLEWTTRRLYRHFKREIEPGGSREVAAAIARAMESLGDTRAIDEMKEHLYAGGQSATDNAYLLAETSSKLAIETLFWFAADPPAAPAFRNTPLAMSALEQAGPTAVDVLRPFVVHKDHRARWLLVDVITRSGHPDAENLLGDLARDDSMEVRDAALDALAQIGTENAARKLYNLRGYVPHEPLIRALSAITHPAGPEYLRQLAPRTTTVEGIVLGAERQPLVGAYVQIIEERHLGMDSGWGWRAVSARARTDSEGAFVLSIFGADEASRLRLKVVTPLQRDGSGQDTYEASLPVRMGERNYLNALIDRFFDRLVIDMKQDVDSFA